MRLQTKIILVTLMVFIISFSFMGILIFSNSRLILEKQIETKLISLSQINEKNIQTFLNGQKNKIELIATQDELTNEELKEMISLDDSFYEIFVIGSNGTVLVSSNPERVGLDRANRSYFINARNNTYINPVYFALVPQEYSIATSTPFQGGVLVGAIKLDTLNKIVSDRTGLGKTEEMLMAFINEKEEVVYFTKRIFSDKKIEILTKEDSRDHPIYYAFQKEEVLLKGLKNYRGAEVISFTNYVDEIQVGMLTQIDIAEAFSEIENLKKITFFLVIIMIILTTIVIYIVARQVAKEIIYISESIDKVTKGDLGMQLKKSSLYEIQTLINSLNRILASMKLAILRTGVSASDLGIGEVVRAKEEAEEKYNNLYEN